MKITTTPFCIGKMFFLRFCYIKDTTANKGREKLHIFKESLHIIFSILR